VKQRVRIFLALAIAFLGLCCFASGQEDFLKVDASVVPRRLSRGEEGTVLLKLSLQPGISVSPHPDFIIEFQPSEEIVFPKNFFTASDLEIEVLEEGGTESLNLQKPIKIPFTVGLKARRGSYILAGRIKYYARSKTGDWCVKNTAKFFAAYSTRVSPVKKPS
jgi:hypothetical protein